MPGCQLNTGHRAPGTGHRAPGSGPGSGPRAAPATHRPRAESAVRPQSRARKGPYGRLDPAKGAFRPTRGGVLEPWDARVSTQHRAPGTGHRAPGSGPGSRPRAAPATHRLRAESAVRPQSRARKGLYSRLDPANGAFRPTRGGALEPGMPGCQLNTGHRAPGSGIRTRIRTPRSTRHPPTARRVGGKTPIAGAKGALRPTRRAERARPAAPDPYAPTTWMRPVRLEGWTFQRIA